uniref:fibropellin-1-like isoform X2 n=1 Tax=Ciona intestinalis TaxID=7719 RepID=UPI000EF51887|nr:fibropellin-1-like isoform X2 [Ciona intestinalis]|eukprot:XP_026689503.1 fibropellin-1-like isoform X2 [Ciona intestinalis]
MRYYGKGVYLYLMLIIDSVTSQSELSLFDSCGANITEDEGRITSPNYPQEYPNNAFCVWKIKTDVPNMPIQITITAIDIENARSCQYDFLSVRFTGEAERKFCGRRVDGGPMQGPMPADVTLSSDGSLGGSGFSLNFQVLSPCLSDPCLNGGTCTYDVSSYTCACADGWEGVNCEQDVDECASLPCNNNGTCTDRVNDFTCSCMAGVSGDTCDVIEDHCVFLVPCKNSGTCQNTRTYYRCTCMAGYHGQDCENEIDECLSNPCQNGGSCTDRLAGYDCQCDDGISGKHCEVRPTTTTAPSTTITTTASPDEVTTTTIPEILCAVDSAFQCLNGGSCVVLNRVTETCLCTEGYEGNRCENEELTYFYAMVGTTAGSVICVILLVALVCWMIYKRKQPSGTGVTVLNHQNNSSSPDKSIPPASGGPKEAWPEKNGEHIEKKENFIGRNMSPQSPTYESIPMENVTSPTVNDNVAYYTESTTVPFPQQLPQTVPPYPNNVQAHPANRRFSLPVADPTHHQANGGTGLSVGAVMSIYQVLNAIQNSNGGVPSQQRVPDKKYKWKSPDPNKNREMYDGDLSSPLSSAEANFPNNPIKGSPPSPAGVRKRPPHAPLRSNEPEVKKRAKRVEFSENINQWRQPAPIREPRRGSLRMNPLQIKRFDDVRSYNYFDQFTRDMSGRTSLRLNRENAFLFD